MLKTIAIGFGLAVAALEPWLVPPAFTAIQLGFLEIETALETASSAMRELTPPAPPRPPDWAVKAMAAGQSRTLQPFTYFPGMPVPIFVCPDWDTTKFVFHWYGQHFGDLIKAHLFGDLSLRRGRYSPVGEPPLADLGCFTVPEGTRVRLAQPGAGGWGYSAVAGDGFYGVTMPQMIR